MGLVHRSGGMPRHLSIFRPAATHANLWHLVLICYNNISLCSRYTFCIGTTCLYLIWAFWPRILLSLVWPSIVDVDILLKFVGPAVFASSRPKVFNGHF